MTDPFVFPQDVPDESTGTGVRREGGMTLRDYFAGQILTCVWPMKKNTLVAAIAYDVADAMLAEREKRKP